MRVAVVGSGYVGLVTGAGLASTGNDVVCIDRSADRIAGLESGTVPFYEPGLGELLDEVRQRNHLSFTTDLPKGVSGADVVFLAVGTPQGANGSADTSQVLTAAREIGEALTGFAVIATKSTVPVGTSERVRDVVAGATEWPFAVASNPEFLKEGDAVNDFLRPSRIVIGADDAKAREVLERLYSPFNLRERRVVHMDITSAELTKYAANALLATKISFMNEIAVLCDLVGADVEMVRQAVGADPRIGSAFIYPGIGYGGSCFPKDVRAVASTAREHGYRFAIAEAVDAVNARQRRLLMEKLVARFGDDLRSKTFAVWGLSFKPGTDDVREAPALDLIESLLSAGANVRVYDPKAMMNARLALGDRRVYYADSTLDAARGANAVCLCTEWPDFRQPDFDELKQVMAEPMVFDGRNIYDPTLLLDLGFEYFGVGRP
jgi:UDPglucose 6-dehydrogenase